MWIVRLLNRLGPCSSNGEERGVLIEQSAVRIYGREGDRQGRGPSRDRRDGGPGREAPFRRSQIGSGIAGEGIPLRLPRLILKTGDD